MHARISDHRSVIGTKFSTWVIHFATDFFREFFQISTQLLVGTHTTRNHHTLKSCLLQCAFTFND
ncbi:Uncharacterised protein [Vibrio cholerae]|nr:Uncharacterised protein [Vibrio cholerae]